MGQSGAEKKKVLLDKQSSGAGKQPKVGGRGGDAKYFSQILSRLSQGKQEMGRDGKCGYIVNMDI